MAEGKLYKTKLCLLYEKGHCPRQSCSFAHGHAELRRFSGMRDDHDSDLRGNLGRRRSPPRRYSPRRDARGYSPRRPIESRSDRKRRTRQELDDGSDLSGSSKFSDKTNDQIKNKKPKSSDSKESPGVQLRQLQSDIDYLDNEKRQLKIYLEGKVREADSLTSKIQELDMELSEEKEKCKRISSKIKKFIKTYNRHMRIKDELQRSEARLQKLVNKLGSDGTRPGATEDDASVDILSDAETFDNHASSLRNELRKNASSTKKTLQMYLVDANEETKQANLTKGKRFMSEAVRVEKLYRPVVNHAQLNLNKEAEAKSNESYGPSANQDKPKRGKLSNAGSSADKLKGYETGPVLPSTSIAAHAVEEVEIVEMDSKFDFAENGSTAVDKGILHGCSGYPFPLPPPPPIPPNAYLQHEGDNMKVDVDGLDEEAVDVDII